MQYGKEYEFDAPVKLLDKHLHAMAQSVDEQLVVVSQVGFFCAIKRYSLPLISKSHHPYQMQVLVSDINIGYEEIVNTQVCINLHNHVLMMLPSTLYMVVCVGCCFQWQTCEKLEMFG